MRRAGTGTGTLFWTLMLVTIGFLLLAILMGFASANVAYSVLSSAAQEAAWSGQAQITESTLDVGGDQGYFNAQLEDNGANKSAQQAWLANVQDLQLQGSFTNLNMSDEIQNNEVTVTATGDYPVPFLPQAFGNVFGGRFSQSFSVPMKVIVQGASS